MNDRDMRHVVATAIGGIPEEVLVTLQNTEDVLSWAQKYCAHLTMPFDLHRDVRVCYERMIVRPAITDPRLNSKLFKTFSETEDPWMLVYDSTGSGADSLFFVRFDSEAQDHPDPYSGDCLRCFQMSGDKYAELLFGRRHSLAAMAATLPTFISND